MHPRRRCERESEGEGEEREGEGGGEGGREGVREGGRERRREGRGREGMERITYCMSHILYEYTLPKKLISN
jgi:hypothetical protein